MTLVTRTSGLGLVVCEESADEAQLGRALKQIDPKLVLQKHPGPIVGGWVYKVFVVLSDDQPAVCIYTWADEYGNPLPLSSGLLDGVRKLRRDVRERHGLIDADEKNRLHVERAQKQSWDETTAIMGDHRARLDRSQTQISFSSVGRPGQGKRTHRPRSGIKK